MTNKKIIRFDKSWLIDKTFEEIKETLIHANVLSDDNLYPNKDGYLIIEIIES